MMKLFLVAVAALSINVTQAQTPAEVAKITEKLTRISPGEKIDKITKIEALNLFEVSSGHSVVYVDGTARFLFQGELLDLDNQVNLTEKRVNELNKVDFNSLPVADAIVSVKGNGKRKLAIFSDPDCPYCKKLEVELAKLKDVTIYTYLYPIVSLHAKSLDRATSVWCSPDRAKSWETAMKSGDLPSAHCETPISRNIELGRKLGVYGTPTLIFSNGKRVPGLIDVDQINGLIGS